MILNIFQDAESRYKEVRQAMGIGERIAKLRKRANLTQKQLAGMVGVSGGMIAQIERGTKTLSLQLGKMIARALKVDILQIIGRD